MTRPIALFVLFLALLLPGCATTSKRIILTGAGIVNLVDKTAAPLYAQASAAALRDPVILSMAKSGPGGPDKALAEWRKRMEPWEKLRHAVNLARAALLDSGRIVDAAQSPDRERQALLATAGGVSVVADLLRALPALGITPSPWLKSSADALCAAAEGLTASLVPAVPPACAAPPSAPPALPAAAPAPSPGPPTLETPHAR